VLLVALAWVLMVPLSPAPFQASPGGNIAGYRAQGLVPEPGHVTLSREIGHEVFEIPEEDARHRAAAAAGSGGHAMEAMDMGELEEGGPGGGHGGGGLMVMPARMAHMAGRTIEIEMHEWGFAPPRITVKPDEVIHFKGRNRGRLPHEFMFMPQTGMNAVGYRLERADWNLTEHEVGFEQALVLPSDGFETVVKVEPPGMWMFMFPYHMQFGMMGMMLTEGMTMEGDMGGMKM
jgi:uncharacterized cupredoxin-like copper-binding protein